MTRIILTRHGQTEWNKPPHRFRGRAELALSDLGTDEARATARRIAASCTPVAVYSSPLERCLITGQVIAEPFHLRVAQLPGLVDIDYGEWEGLTEEEARSGWPEMYDTWTRAPHCARPPGGETLQDVFARASGALHAVLRRHAGETVVLVGHDSVNRILLLHALDLALSHYRCLAQDNCGLNELEFAAFQFRIKSLNETAHLAAIGPPPAAAPSAEVHA
ncbi:MAG TPA: histidine phosphatase family protein [Casimicrobiaceae bacterium]|nr:histidine phosphatase family protein [Casimicrobiaceae bacterium]